MSLGDQNFSSKSLQEFAEKSCVARITALDQCMVGFCLVAGVEKLVRDVKATAF